jgi:serine/threonine protein kinase
MTFPLQSLQSMAIVMEYASGGELKEYLQKRGRLEEKEAYEIFNQLLLSVDYCHQKRIVHRDLKLSNIVFSSPHSKDIRVVDFGISGVYAPLSKSDKSLAGSLKYLAPEVITHKNTAADPALDIFSLGVILYALVVGKLPFDGTDQAEIKRKIVSCEYSYPPNVKVSEACKDLIASMLKTDPRDRIPLKEIQHHEWVKTVHLAREESKQSFMSSVHEASINIPDA